MFRTLREVTGNVDAASNGIDWMCLDLRRTSNLRSRGSSRIYWRLARRIFLDFFESNFPLSFSSRTFPCLFRVELSPVFFESNFPLFFSSRIFPCFFRGELSPNFRRSCIGARLNKINRPDHPSPEFVSESSGNQF